MDNYEVLSDEVIQAIEKSLVERPEIATEIEVGSPPGVFIGVQELPDEEEITVYIYLADRRAHNEFDRHTQTTDEPSSAMFEESLQLNRISTELLTLLDTLVESISMDKDVFRNIKPDLKEDEEGQIGEYYGLKFPISDVKTRTAE